jgi:hypothetical protein
MSSVVPGTDSSSGRERNGIRAAGGRGGMLQTAGEGGRAVLEEGGGCRGERGKERGKGKRRRKRRRGVEGEELENGEVQQCGEERETGKWGGLDSALLLERGSNSSLAVNALLLF